MFKIGAILAAVFAVAWLAVPQFRASLIVLAPFAIFAICPLAMLIGMYGMHAMGRGAAKRHPDCCSGHAESSTGKGKAPVT